MRRCRSSTRAITGTMTTREAAISSPHGIVYALDCAPTLEIITGTVQLLLSDSNDNANRYSFHAAITARIAVAASPGAANGIMTRQNVCIADAPSMYAASSS